MVLDERGRTVTSEDIAALLAEVFTAFTECGMIVQSVIRRYVSGHSSTVQRWHPSSCTYCGSPSPHKEQQMLLPLFQRGVCWWAGCACSTPASPRSTDHWRITET